MENQMQTLCTNFLKKRKDKFHHEIKKERREIMFNARRNQAFCSETSEPFDIFEVENWINLGIIQSHEFNYYKPLSIEDKIMYARKMFHQLKNELISSNLKKLPSKYSIPYVYISMNNLLPGQYFENMFSYFLTKYRKKLIKTTNNFLKSDYNYFLISSIQPSGKSCFLIDLLLRIRLEEEYSNFRVLYINNKHIFSDNPYQYIVLELIYQLYDDIDQNQAIQNFPLPPLAIFHKEKNQLINWLYFLESKNNLEAVEYLLEFFINLKLYIDSLGKKCILIWDQIDNLYCPCEKKEKIWFDAICRSEFFDFLILCTSDINGNFYWKEYKNVYHLEINPHKVFQTEELRSLINYETKSNLPIDISSQIQDYAKEVYNMIEGSLLKYQTYKKMIKGENNHIKAITQNFDEIKSNIDIKNNNTKDNSSYNFENCFKFRRNLEFLKGELQKKFYKNGFVLQIKKKKSSIKEINKTNSTLISEGDFKTAYIEIIRQKKIQNILKAKKSFKKEGMIFQNLVQTFYLIPNRQILLNKNILITIDRVSKDSTFSTIITNIKSCSEKNVCKAYHFIETDNWAFDSLIFDDSSKSFIMVQITVNGNHKIDYEKLERLIMGEEDQNSKKNKNLNEFFREIRNCGFKFYYLWITDTQKNKISMKIENFRKTQFGKLIVVDQLEDVHEIILS